MPRFTDFDDGRMSIPKEELFKRIYTPIADLKVTAYWSAEPLPFDQRQNGKKLNLNVGDSWGGLFDCAWFHFEGKVPKSAVGKKVVALLDNNGEMCVVDKAGTPVQGLTAKSSQFGISPPGKWVVPISDNARGGEVFDVWADAGCNDLFGRFKNGGRLECASIGICDDDMKALAYDFFVLHDFWEAAPKGSPRSRQIRHALQKATTVLLEYTPEEVKEARRILAPMLAKRNGDASLHVHAIGHGHLDLAWMWPERETKRKGARTFATALHLLKRYPEYRWIKEDHPALYKEIKKAVKAGRIECQGAMWVESDTNIPCGESLVRQLLYGKRFFEQEFGVSSNYLWLPDVFGYTAALPQLGV